MRSPSAAWLIIGFLSARAQPSITHRGRREASSVGGSYSSPALIARHANPSLPTNGWRCRTPPAESYARHNSEVIP